MNFRKISALFFSWVLYAALLPAEDETGPDLKSFYTLRPGDVVRVVVFNEPDLSVEQKLDPDGVIIVPLLGRVSLEGLNLREAEGHLETRFQDEEFLIQPQVTLAITQYMEQVFYVYGEVNNPGAKAFPAGKQSVDILQAITLAGDLTQYAKRSEVILRRPIKGTDEEERITIDLDKAMRGSRKRDQDLVKVYPQDLIFVPERLF